jgi:hypothetical protein
MSVAQAENSLVWPAEYAWPLITCRTDGIDATAWLGSLMLMILMQFVAVETVGAGG